MSLFDVIRYPISNPPTEAEFAALPSGLLAQWYPETGWIRYTSTDKSPYYLAEYYYRQGVHSELILLRQMIKDYDEPI